MNGMTNKHLIFLDTNLFIYFFEGKGVFGLKAKKVFELLATNKAEAVTSIITQIELLSLKSSDESSKHLLELFLETPNLTVENLGPEIANEAARVRRIYGFRTPDAIQLATAIYCKAEKFITNDKRLASFKEIKIEFL